jgi:hypothetical protein
MRLLLRFLLLTVLCSSVDVKRGDGYEPVLDEQQASKTRPLHACALSDFVDEASGTKHRITKTHLRSLMQILKGAGIKTVSWGYYADADGGHLVPRSMQSVTNTYKHLGNPLAVAVKAAHAEGIGVFGYFKPYEMGVSMVSPLGSREAKEEGHFELIGGKLVWADPFVAQHPQYCIQHRSSAFPEPNRSEPVASIKLYKHNDQPTRITKDNLQIWVSSNNYQYTRLDVDFEFAQTFEKARKDVQSLSRGRITKAGDRVLVLQLSGLRLTEPYLLVTTDLRGKGDFSNASTSMLRAYDKTGREIIGCFANGMPIYNASRTNFRNWGLMFDTGYGLRMATLDTDNSAGNRGFIAFARGRAPRLGAPCESEPAVQAYWLKCVKDILDAGADGVEFRIENHSTHTDFPYEYGYNQAVLARLEDPKNATPAQIAKVRGDAYTEFLVKAKEIIRARDKKMRLNFEVDSLREHVPANRLLAYPANMDVQWKRWIELDLPDEAVIRHYGFNFDQIMNDARTAEIVSMLDEKSIPVFFNRYMRNHEKRRFLKDIDTIRSRPEYTGYVFYEVYSYVNYNADGTCTFKYPEITKAIRHAAQCDASHE